jgi:hypothetical protein
VENAIAFIVSMFTVLIMSGITGCAGKRFVVSDCAYVGAQSSPSEWVCSPQKK